MLQKSSTGFGGWRQGCLARRPGLWPRSIRWLRASRIPGQYGIIFLFMHGGVSQVDRLTTARPAARHRQAVSGNRASSRAQPATRRLAVQLQAVQCGQWASDIFRIASMSDDLCFIKSMYGRTRHGSALLELHTGSDTFIRPSMGSWQLRAWFENQNLPGYITFKPRHSRGMNAWSSAFLPALSRGQIGTNATPSTRQNSVHRSQRQTALEPARELDLLAQINREHQRTRSRQQTGGPHQFVRAGLPHAAAALEQNIDNKR